MTRLTKNLFIVFLSALLLFPALAQDSESKESAFETIRKSMKDLESDDKAKRHRAVLILSKYEDRVATTAILNALEDNDDRVNISDDSLLYHHEL